MDGPNDPSDFYDAVRTPTQYKCVHTYYLKFKKNNAVDHM